MSEAPLQCRAFGLTHPGMLRRSNQDAFWMDESAGVFSVADGVGGLPGGAKASQRAVDFVRGRAFALAAGECSAASVVLAAHEAIRALGHRISPGLGIGTTLSLGVLRDHTIELAHVGDCVVYRWSQGRLWRISESHVSQPVLIRNQVVRGGERLERFLGQPTPLEIQTLSVDFLPGDWMLIVSDGLTKTVDDDEIAAILHAQEDPKSLCEALVVISNIRGGPDNTTILALALQEAVKANEQGRSSIEAKTPAAHPHAIRST
ncbi:MAG: serine/threonine-protein phosphatase [Opitutales bacterium]|nr:serine/threonine-protein phosphatase [Opitutales bacterium]